MPGKGGKHTNHERKIAENGAPHLSQRISNQRNDGKSGTFGTGRKEKSLL